jgi:hypothetical protein
MIKVALDLLIATAQALHLYIHDGKRPEYPLISASSRKSSPHIASGSRSLFPGQTLRKVKLGEPSAYSSGFRKG